MAKTGFTMDFRDFNKKFYKIVRNAIPELGERGLFQGGALLIRDAITETPAVPKSRGISKPKGSRWTGPGHLRRSQKVEKPVITSREISVEVGFNTDYAAYVHEAPSNLNWSTPGTGPKFLETKLARHKDKYMRKVAEVIEAGGR